MLKEIQRLTYAITFLPTPSFMNEMKVASLYPKIIHYKDDCAYSASLPYDQKSCG